MKKINTFAVFDEKKTWAKKNSMPVNPAKFTVSKKLIGRAIKIGYIDTPHFDTGIIVDAYRSKLFRVSFFNPATGTTEWVDSKDQVIALGTAQIKLKF